MPSFPYLKDFEPVVKIGDYVKIFGKFYVIEHVEPVQPEIVNLLDSKHANLTSLAAAGSAGDRSKVFDMEDDFALVEGWFGQWRIDLVDDIILEIGLPEAADALWSKKKGKTYLMKENPVNGVSKYQSGAASTDVLLWKTTNYTDPPAGKWVAKIKKLILTEESGSAAVVRFGDASTGGGSEASATSAKLSVAVGASETVALKDNELPNYEFVNGIVFQTTGGNVRITAEIEEKGIVVPFKSNNYKEFYTFGDKKYPWATVYNRISVTQTKARISVAGFKYKIREIEEKPNVWLQIPVGVFKG